MKIKLIKFSFCFCSLWKIPKCFENYDSITGILYKIISLRNCVSNSARFGSYKFSIVCTTIWVAMFLSLWLLLKSINSSACVPSLWSLHHNIAKFSAFVLKFGFFPLPFIYHHNLWIYYCSPIQVCGFFGTGPGWWFTIVQNWKEAWKRRIWTGLCWSSDTSSSSCSCR